MLRREEKSRQVVMMMRLERADLGYSSFTGWLALPIVTAGLLCLGVGEDPAQTA